MENLDYLDCAKVHIFIMEMSTFCQFGEVALGKTKPEKHMQSVASHL